MDLANKDEQRILGYGLDGEPQPFCWSAFWQVLICASGEHERNELLQNLLKYDNYADYENITIKQESREADAILASLVDDLHERYAIVAEALGSKAISGCPCFYEPYLTRSGKGHILLIIKEPTKWQPNFYQDNEELLQEVLGLCGRVGVRVIITDKYENVPPSIRVFISTNITRLCLGV